MICGIRIYLTNTNIIQNLREQQKNVRDNHDNNTKQVAMWIDLEKLLNVSLLLEKTLYNFD